jgi:hypothetical protein
MFGRKCFVFLPVSKRDFTSQPKGRNQMKASKLDFRFIVAMVGMSTAAWFASTTARASVLYYNGFEPGQPGTTDFADSTLGTQPPPPTEMAVVPSGGGTLHLPAASGSYYAEVHNVDDAYSIANGYPLGYGQSVATDYGYVRNGGTFVAGAPTGPGVASNGSPFYESSAIYIDPSWSAPGSAANDNQGFWVDTTPYNDPNYADETNFRVNNGGNGTINVQMVGYGTNTGSGYPSVSITQPGWYTFKTTFEDAAGNVANTLSVSDAGGTILGSAYNDPTLYTPLAWNDLQGTNYGDWFTVWSNGFANDTIGIDSVEVGTVPEPASLSLIGLGVPLLLRRRRRA